MTHPYPESIQYFSSSSWLEGTYKNHTKMLVIIMSPNISDTKPKMATTCQCEQKEEKSKHQHTKKKTKKHLEKPELNELRV